ncbi:MAG: restriction endonuclease subunit S, partial [Gammaproteobacteria bacterium]|nr:restriction endonuclease subunit S [Gammaproteobacteria bacterium]
MKTVALAEIAAITAGQSPPGSTYNEDGAGLPFFQGKADFGETHPTARKWCTAPKKIAEAGDILISVRAPVGPTNIAAERCCIGRGLAAIRPDDKVALPDFVHWVLKYREPELAAKGIGSTFTAIGQKDLRSLLVPLPPLDEQRRIVDILNRAARIQALRRRAADRLREFVPALFVRMFGDPVENPMGWEVRPLADLVQE